MTPNIADRLDSMIQAMVEIVVPAIVPDEYLAKDQAGLVIAHLTMIRAQLPMVDAFERLELKTITALGRELAAVATGGVETVRACERLAAHLDEDEGDGPGDREERCQRLNAAVENLVRCSRIDGDADAMAQIAAKILKNGLATTWRDRVWFKGSGFDAEEYLLPDRGAIFG